MRLKKGAFTLNQGRVIVPPNEPPWNAPTLVAPPTVIVPLAEEDSLLPKNGLVLKLTARAVAAPVDVPVALLVPDIGAAMLAVVVLWAPAVVPPNAKPVLVTPAADWVPTCERLLIFTLPTVPPLPNGMPKIDPAGLMALAACVDDAVPACEAPALDEPAPKPKALVVVLPWVEVVPVAEAW